MVVFVVVVVVMVVVGVSMIVMVSIVCVECVGVCCGTCGRREYNNCGRGSSECIGRLINNAVVEGNEVPGEVVIVLRMNGLVEEFLLFGCGFLVGVVVVVMVMEM